MLNSVNTADINVKNNVFTRISPNSGANPYWLSGKSEGEEFIPPKYRKYKLAKQIGEGVVAVGIIATGSALFIINGGPKAITKYANKLSAYVDKNIQKAKLQNEKVGISQIILRKIANILSTRFEAVNNFNTIKDYSLKQILIDKNGTAKNIIGKVHKKITNMFEKIAQKAVLSSYRKTGAIFDETKPVIKNAQNSIGFRGLSDSVEINGVVRTKQEWLDILTKENNELFDFYDANFSKIQTGKRFYNFKNSASQAIEKYFGSKGFFWFLSKDTMHTFAAQSAVEAEKIAYKQKLLNIRNSISYSYKDLAKIAPDCILRITKSINSNDFEKLRYLTDLENDFKILGKSDNKAITEKIRKRILSRLNALSKVLENDSDKQEISNLKSLVQHYKPGKVQNILEIYEKILPPKEFAKVKKAYMRSVKSLDKSINLESEDCTSKIRDLQLGSAPTDILSILGGMVTLGYFLAKSDDNNKRISVSLKYGLPALTTIGTVTYANTRLFAGTKSLLLGAISGAVSGKICGYLNDKFLERTQSNKKYTEIG